MKKFLNNKFVQGILFVIFMNIHILLCLKYKISFLDMGIMVFSISVSKTFFDLYCNNKRGE